MNLIEKLAEHDAAAEKQGLRLTRNFHIGCSNRLCQARWNSPDHLSACPHCGAAGRVIRYSEIALAVAMEADQPEAKS